MNLAEARQRKVMALMRYNQSLNNFGFMLATASAEHIEAATQICHDSLDEFLACCLEEHRLEHGGK